MFNADENNFCQMRKVTRCRFAEQFSSEFSIPKNIDPAKMQKRYDWFWDQVLFFLSGSSEHSFLTK